MGTARLGLLLLSIFWITGCGSPGEFGLVVINESPVPVTVRGARPPNKVVPPRGSEEVYVPRTVGDVVTLESPSGTETFKVGDPPALGGSEQIVYVYGTPPMPFWSANCTELYGKDAKHALSEVQPLAGKMAALPSNATICTPSQPVPQQMRPGRHLYRIVHVPAQIKDVAAATQFILADTGRRIAAQRQTDKTLPPHR